MGSPCPDITFESDSDFYGDEETVARLHDRVDEVASQQYQGGERSDPAAAMAQKQAPCGQPTRLHNPYSGVPYAWQLTEGVHEFLSRLPPATTVASLETPWIYACNPFIERKGKAESGNQGIRGSEDEGPEEESSRTILFEAGGRERLELLTSFMEHASRNPGPANTRARELTRERTSAVKDILDLAWTLHVRCGKWMLFPEPTSVNEVWETVVRATVRNELGIAAKVAPRNPTGDPKKERLICIYTADFRDVEDIARVLKRIRELGLIQVPGRPIYYKCDAYTYLGIGSGNKWGIKASIYSSTDVFGSLEKAG